jgi:uncharacterized protein involved in cysteine biosynthesis
MDLSRLAPAFTRALAQLPSPRFLSILAAALGLTLLVTGPFLLVVISIAGLIDIIPLPGFLQSGSEGSWLGWSSWLFWTYIMSPLAVAIVALLLDPIVEAVEARHYPDLPQVRRRGLGTVIGYALRFLGLMLGVSLGAALVAWLTPVPGWLVFTAATGYLVAREYAETVALRRMSEPEAKGRFHADLGTLWLAGIGVALALNIPLVNLVAPILGVAAFTHLLHGPSRSRP